MSYNNYIMGGFRVQGYVIISCVEKRNRQLPLLILLLVAFFIFFLSQSGIFAPIRSLFEAMIVPLENIYGFSVLVRKNTFTSRTERLAAEIELLSEKLVDQNELLKENAALKDQFQTTSVHNPLLVPAKVVGVEGFLPGSSSIESMVINKGASEGIKKGQAVIVGKSVIGIIREVSARLARVQLVTSKDSSIPATVSSENQGVLGIVRGTGGGGMVLDNVLLSETLNVGDIVVSKGDLTMQKEGFLPHLILGRVESVNKQFSQLFQTANLKSLVDVSRLSIVFVVLGWE